MAQDPDSSPRSRCKKCNKWMLSRPGVSLCPECSKGGRRAQVAVKNSADDEAVDPHDQSQCSYCGASIYFDSARCPKCGEYTDGLGKFGDSQQATEERKRLPKIFVLAAWLVIFCILLPLMLAIYYALKR